MKFVVAANHRFKDQAMKCIYSITDLNYSALVYDLGGLGFGFPFEVKDQSFQSTGCYKTGFTKWRSRAMHVCDVVKQAFLYTEPGETLVYLDADTRLLSRIDEVEALPFAVGVTIRPENEWPMLGRANSGVVLFRNCIPARLFVDDWSYSTTNTGSIQEGLNTTLEKVKENDLAHVEEFPTAIYNNYHEPNNPPPGTKIIHYRASITDI